MGSLSNHMLAAYKRLLLVYVLVFFGSSVAFAQTPESLPKKYNVEATLTSEIENAITSLLERNIPPEQMQIAIEIELSEQALSQQIPYVPGADLRLPKGANVDRLRPYIKQLSLQVFLTDRVRRSSATTVTKLLETKLKIGKKFGDQVVIDSLGIDVPRPQSEVERELLSAESKLRDLEQTIKKTNQERDDAKLEAVTTKNELDRLAREKTTSVTSGPQSLWDRYGLAIVIGGAALLSMIALGMMLFIASRSLGAKVKEGIGSVAAALESGMQALTSSSQSSQSGDNTWTMKLDGGAGGGLLPGGNTTGQGSAIPLDSLQSRLLELHEELLERVNDMTEAIMLRHVDSLLAQQATVAKGVVTMELLGRDKANELFERLSPSGQDEVLRFLREGSYGRSKGELMLEAGEELKTKLLAEAFDQALFKPNKDILERLLKISDEELAALVSTLEDALIPRFLRNLEPTRIASLMTQVKDSNPQRFRMVVESLHKIGAAQSMEDLDKPLIEALDETIAKIREDSERPYLKFYRAIVEAADERLTDEILAGFAEAPRVSSYLEEHVITLSTLFKIPASTRGEIIERISNKDIAALAAGLTEDQQTQLLAVVSDRRLELVTEEIERLNSRGQVFLMSQHSKAKTMIITKLRQLKEEGLLDLSQGKEKPLLPGTVGQNNDKAVA